MIPDPVQRCVQAFRDLLGSKQWVAFTTIAATFDDLDPESCVSQLLNGWSAARFAGFPMTESRRSLKAMAGPLSSADE